MFVIQYSDSEEALNKMMDDYQKGDITKVKIFELQENLYEEEETQSLSNSEEVTVEEQVAVRKSVRERKRKLPFDGGLSSEPAPSSSTNKAGEQKGKSRKLSKSEQKTAYNEVMDQISDARSEVCVHKKN